MHTRNLLALRRGPTIWLRPRRNSRGPTSASVRVSADLFPNRDGRSTLPIVDLDLENRELRAIAARLIFRDDRSVETSAALTLLPGETRTIGDALSWLGAPDDAGRLSLEPAEEGTDLSWSVRAYPRDLSGSAAAGSRIPGSASRWIADLSATDGLVSEVSAVNRTGSPRIFGARLHSSNGSELGARFGISVAPGEQRVWPLTELFEGVAGRGLTLELEPAAGSALPELRASVADSGGVRRGASPAERPAARFFLPASGRTAGVGDTFFATDLALANAGSESLAVLVTFLEAERDNASPRASRVVLGPRETRTIPDALGSLFGLTETSGFLVLEAERSDLVPSARLTARSESAPDVVSGPISAVRDGQLSVASLLVAPSRAEGPMPAVTLLNPGAEPNPAVLAWLDESGQTLSETAVVLPPGGLMEIASAAGVSSEAVSVVVQTERIHLAYFGRTGRIPGRTDGGVPRRRIVVR